MSAVRGLYAACGRLSPEGFVDGVIYLTQKNNKTLSISNFDTLYENDLKVLTEQVRSGKISVGDRNRKREITIVDNLLADYTKGLIEYDT